MDTKMMEKNAAKLMKPLSLEDQFYVNFRNQHNNIVGKFKNYVDDFVRNNGDPKFYGKWAYRLIIHETISPYIIFYTENYLKEEKVFSNSRFDKDDYYSHRAFLDLTMSDYEGFIFHLEKMSANATSILNILRYVSVNRMLKQSLDNYSKKCLNTNVTTRDLSVVHNVNLNLKEYLFVLVKLQSVVHYWSNINSDMPYLECSSALSLVARTFEEQFKNLTLRHDSGFGGNTIRQMQDSLKNHGFPDFETGYKNAAFPSCSNPVSLNANWTVIKSTLNNNSLYAGNQQLYAGMIFEVCRMIRNNSQHAIDFSNKLFNSSDQFREYVDVLLEGILLTLKY